MSFVINPYRFSAADDGSPTTADLLAYWALDNRLDSHTGEYDLTITGSIGFGSANTPPNPDAATFGTGVSLSATDAGLPLPTGAQTFAAWVRTIDNGANQDIMGCWGAVPNRAFLFRKLAANQLNFRISSNGTDNVTIDTTTTISDLTWTHVCAVFVPSTSITIYIDGVADAPNTTSIPATVYDSTEPFVMGNRTIGGTSGTHWLGQIDEACIFDKALSADEVAWLAGDKFYADL